MSCSTWMISSEGFTRRSKVCGVILQNVPHAFPCFPGLPRKNSRTRRATRGGRPLEVNEGRICAPGLVQRSALAREPVNTRTGRQNPNSRRRYGYALRPRRSGADGKEPLLSSCPTPLSRATTKKMSLRLLLRASKPTTSLTKIFRDRRPIAPRRLTHTPHPRSNCARPLRRCLPLGKRVGTPSCVARSRPRHHSR